MKYHKTYVIDTPNIIRYMENKNPNYIKNFYSMISLIFKNQTSKFIVMITPWIQNNMPNLCQMKMNNIESIYSINYDCDPDVALFKVSRERSGCTIISNDKFDKKTYREYKEEIDKKIGFILYEENGNVFMKCNIGK